MEESLNVYVNGRQSASWQAYLDLAFPELGTVQAQLVSILYYGIFSAIAPD